ncbi:hypothetical protein KJS94_08885 [Flavihumibacter rivuli]|uniref:hypothetical protein n=1 Tax=Flavihumibacter rivuli TaxID=2838156 RepID=UPI001BDF561F|nr:hypothetical protein [Flavihumibacter rivuli]ULQ58308.1 hypothetical protein KJS94_08885 [Flavihumibacter rivuli]
MAAIHRNYILLVHGIFLLLVTTANTFQSLVGLSSGKGIFGFLNALPIAEVGLFQAYLLMMLIGIVLLLNMRSEHSWKYDLIGAVAHLIPLLALVFFYSEIRKTMGADIIKASCFIHLPWITIELITAFVLFRRSVSKA